MYVYICANIYIYIYIYICIYPVIWSFRSLAHPGYQVAGLWDAGAPATFLVLIRQASGGGGWGLGDVFLIVYPLKRSGHGLRGPH